ncbi:hypothetical protein DV515_00014807 [Chloebia gouldiae]|uniref:Uncharacterized protein n=1 Tax=Chloebia gouldiae TaxID=44316 RepID=A0A3L8RX13_CHLGU|nr:hypothetical protein DV515_00014807 [Chloebia gouldiae]
MEKIMDEVSPSCLSFPFTFNQMCSLCGSAIFSLGTKSLTGQEEAKPLAKVQGSPFILHCSCVSRAVMSRHRA